MTILITGASRGIGYAAALALAADSRQTLILAGHHVPRLNDALYKIHQNTGNDNLLAMPLMSRLFSFGSSAEKSGGDLAYLATSPELNGVSGRYFNGREMAESSADSYDRQKALDLWQTSIQLCDLQPPESPLLDEDVQEAPSDL